VPRSAAASIIAEVSADLPARFGRYRPTRKLGEGGMGVVYAAHDDELDRPVAIKTFHHDAVDPSAGERLRREARAAASVNHPNICQVYEIGEHGSQIFIAMELLEGEPLAGRIARGALTVTEAVGIALAILAALEPLHQRGLVHRDLKPSNVFLTPHGVKLLDFGLARQIGRQTETTALTLPGVVVGSPGYMAPEQIAGDAIDARADLFAVGAILYEMLVGRAPFAAASMMETLTATLKEQPAAIAGSAAIAAADRVVRRALAKRPDDRFESSAAMAAAIRPLVGLVDSTEVPRAHAVTRLVVLPFRMLRADPETDFLAFSLADAIASTLSGLGSLVVRSSATASSLAGAETDLRKIATEAEVDVVLMGTLLRIGPQLRVHAQLVAAPQGTILWSESQQVTLGDLFQLQDDLSRRLVASLALPLTAREHRQLGRDVPASAKAYELFLRANQHFYHPIDWTIARDLYLECLQEDPGYAPAWARLGRCYRLTAKFRSQTEAQLDDSLRLAEEAFTRAFQLNADLAIAHNLYTFLEADIGRATDAVVRLLEQAKRRTSDPEVYAGLVHACRYAGLLDESVAAYRRARQLDPNVPTSAAQTFWMIGDYSGALSEQFGGYTFGYIHGLALASQGKIDEAIRYLAEREAGAGDTMGRTYLAALRATLEGRPADTVVMLSDALLKVNPDPESRYYLARTLARAGAVDRALAELEWIVGRRYNCYRVLLHDPWLDSLRGAASFTSLVHRAESGYRTALQRFTDADGPRLLA
jgi:eukaryotic-like serine/threonine-protein kinase